MEPEGQSQPTNGEDKKPRAPRSDRGLPRRRSLLLSRSASVRFARVAAQLKGGEEELSELLEPWIEKLLAGELLVLSHDGLATTNVPGIEDLALEGLRAKMKGGSDEG